MLLNTLLTNLIIEKYSGMSFATDEEIRIAHNILLKDKSPFDDARVNIIKEDSSCYVQACPGSGKTTALLAKLIILANRLPMSDGKGVCVLTHTNVAIDEIKAKVGSKANVLFSYPNFFGTIQTFLHKYVAAAALHYFYGSQIQYVDNDIAKAVLLKKYSKLSFGNKLKGYIYGQIVSKGFPISDEEINALGGLDVLTAAKIIKKKGPKSKKYIFQFEGYEFQNIGSTIRTQIRAKKDLIIRSQTKEIILNAKVDWEDNKVVINQKHINSTSKSATEFIKLKEEMFKEGILSFEDAYDLAFRYIREKELDFSMFSHKRFKYLFIDEVQDCDHQQEELIKKIFDDEKVIVQRFGDYCQAIYDGDGTDVEDNEELKTNTVLHIHNSNRFGEKIARPLRSMCMEDNHQLVGNEEIPSVKPIIITYEDPIMVLHKYAGLLRSIRIPEMDNMSVLDIANKEKNEDPLHRINIKACGWVGRKGANEQKRYIESYYPLFERKSYAVRLECDSFDSFLLKSHTVSIKEYGSSIIQGIIKFLDLCDIKNGSRRYTITSLLDFLTNIDVKVKEDFLCNIMKWSMHLSKCGDEHDKRQIKETIHNYLTSTLLPLFGKNSTEPANVFFNAKVADNTEEQDLGQGNIFTDGDLEIEVSTVHAVKGETHASTLYLETSYFGKHESERLADQFKGIAYADNNTQILKSLKVAYVGLSRPRYLLCVAIQKSRFNNIDCAELREIWDVVEA